MSNPTPQDFLRKWNLTPAQFGLLMGIQSAQVNRLLAKPTATYGQAATSAQCDRMAELDLLLQIRSRMSERVSILAKIVRLIEGLEIFLKMIGATQGTDMASIDQLIFASNEITESGAMARLNNILARKD